VNDQPNGSDPVPMPDDPVERVRTMLEEIVSALELEASVAVTDGPEEIEANIEGEEVGLLIGRHGQTIDAVQLLCYQAAFRGRPDRKRVIVDAAGYRRRQGEALRRRADEAALDAVRAAKPVELEPMGPSERRVIHQHLRDRPEVETYSEGDEPHRCVVVAPLVSD